jgi:hypothetical protein
VRISLAASEDDLIEGAARVARLWHRLRDRVPTAN